MSDEDNRLFDLLMNKKEDVKEEEQQSSELKDILDDLDTGKVPKLKSTKSTSVIAPNTSDVAMPPQITTPPKAPIPIVQSLASTAPTSKASVHHLPKPPEIPKPAIPMPAADAPNVLDEKPTGDFFKDMQIFFKQLERAYAIRYDLWDNTTLTTLNILRKMNENIEENTDVMITTIQELHKKITKGLKDFELKRNEIERFSDVDFKMVSKTFKKTLELLNFQVREFKLQQSINGLYNIYLN